MTVNSIHTARRDATRYRKAIAGMTDQSGSSCHYYHIGSLVACRPKDPPPVAEYDAWFAANIKSVNNSKMSGSKLRRIVIMRRNGCDFTEIGRAIGLNSKATGKWLAKLPPELSA